MSKRLAIRNVSKLGMLVRELREAASLTRQQLQDQIGVAASTIRNFETGRHKPSAWTLRRLMKSPAMANLPERAKQAGFALDLGQGDTPKDSGCTNTPPEVPKPTTEPELELSRTSAVRQGEKE